MFGSGSDQFAENCGWDFQALLGPRDKEHERNRYNGDMAVYCIRQTWSDGIA